jgi:hypothetical protein
MKTKTATHISKYAIKIVANKTKTLAIKVRDAVKSAIAINCNTVEQTNTFSYSGCSIEYHNIKHFTVKISKLLQLVGTANCN